MKYAKITDMFAKILFSEELLVNKLCRRALCAITALLFVLCSLPAGARTETEAGGITSYERIQTELLNTRSSPDIRMG